MKNRRENNSNMIMTIILGTIAILALTVCIVFICLYLKTAKDYEQSIAQLKESQNGLDTIDFNELDQEEIMGQGEKETVPDKDIKEQEESSESIEETTLQNTEEAMEETGGLFSTFDNEAFLGSVNENALDTVKGKMQELVTMQDAGPITMVRYFFPEKLIFYDNNAYVFSDILQDVAKHNYKTSNFRMDEEGVISYQEEGTVTSHKAIDVSKYQGTINWQEVAADEVEYAFIRLGIRGYKSGEMVMDDTFENNMLQAQNASIKTGVYFFTQAVNETEAVEEANYVIENLEGYDVACPVVFDVEMITDGNGRANNLTKEQRTAICIAFAERIKEAGYTPMIYGNIKCFVNMIDLTRLEDYEKWFAFYDTYLYCPYQISMWQYTEKGKVSGIEGNVDLNVCFKEW